MTHGELSHGWARSSLRDVAHVVRGRVSPQERPELPFVGMDHIEPHTTEIRETVPAHTMRSAAVHFKPGDVLYGRLRPYLNKVACADFEGLASAEFIPLTPPAGILPRFLLYRLHSSDFVSFASHLDEGDRPRVDYQQIGEFAIEVPPLAEQHRIVEAIESYFTRLDDAVATLERVQRNLKRYRASVLKAAVEGRLVPTEAELARAEGREYEPAMALLQRVRSEGAGDFEIDERNPPLLPDGWTRVKLATLLAEPLINGRSVKTASSGFPVLRLTALRGPHVDLSEHKVGDWSAKEAAPFLVRDGDFLVARGNGSIDLVGRGALVPSVVEPMAFPDTMIRVRPSAAMNHRFFVHLWNSALVRRQIERKAKTTAGIFKVNQRDLEDVSLPLPPLAEQARIANEIELQLSRSEATEIVAAALPARINRLRQSILKWAFEGRLVDQDPSDEPASALLERIKAERAASAIPKKGRPRIKKDRDPRPGDAG